MTKINTPTKSVKPKKRKTYTLGEDIKQNERLISDIIEAEELHREQTAHPSGTELLMRDMSAENDPGLAKLWDSIDKEAAKREKLKKR